MREALRQGGRISQFCTIERALMMGRLDVMMAEDQLTVKIGDIADVRGKIVADGDDEGFGMIRR
jgi:hypothetical protein